MLTKSTAHQVPEAHRIGVLPSVFGRHCTKIEGAIFDMAGALLPEYGGGYWEFFRVDGGAFFMAPASRSSEVFAGRPGEGVLVMVENGFADRMSAEAAGIVVCLMTYSAESFTAADGSDYQTAVATQFHLLRDFAASHPEERAIFAAID
jgi:hypothetical protein